ncbi:MAG: ATP-binding protein [Pseudomonadota bacterium]|nr:ATP-binding protein [Pseudomonadota bacterium]
MITRDISTTIKRFAKQYPVVTITGPRQSGKTTLCKALFPEYTYSNLESLEERDFATRDPKGYLARFAQGAVIDEIQHAPNLLSYIQVNVDEKPQPGRYILTGSQNFALSNSISQSLAGRTAIARLLPFNMSEISRIKPPESLDQLLFTGAYPRIHDQNLDPTEALSFYLNTYIERDLRTLINIKDLSRFTTFLKLCAGRSGQLLNFSSLGNDCGVSHNTISHWISMLEASFIIKLLQPYHNNFRKRLIKSPKLYFLDVGLATFLLGIQDKQQLSTHPLRGQLFETLVVTEFLKHRFNLGKTDNLYFFRDSKGNEVDIIMEYGNQLLPIEIKSGITITADFFKGLNYFRKLADSRVENAWLIYGGQEKRLQEKTAIYSWKSLADIELP